MTAPEQLITASAASHRAAEFWSERERLLLSGATIAPAPSNTSDGAPPPTGQRSPDDARIVLRPGEQGRKAVLWPKGRLLYSASKQISVGRSSHIGAPLERSQYESKQESIGGGQLANSVSHWRSAVHFSIPLHGLPSSQSPSFVHASLPGSHAPVVESQISSLEQKSGLNCGAHPVAEPGALAQTSSKHESSDPLQTESSGVWMHPVAPSASGCSGLQPSFVHPKPSSHRLESRRWEHSPVDARQASTVQDNPSSQKASLGSVAHSSFASSQIPSRHPELGQATGNPG